jgi:uncharacterized protein (TIGR03435 family)
MRVSLLIVTLPVLACFAPLNWSQTRDTAEFEVASIKPNLSGRAGYDGFQIEHGSLTVRNVSLKTLIETAFKMQDERIAGGPAWWTADRFDVIAKGSADQSRDQVLAMLCTLLATRFKLATHRETRDLPFYSLEVPKNVAKLPKGSDAPCEPAQQSDPSIFRAPCGSLVLARGPRGIVVIGGRVPVGDLANSLSGFAGRPIVDHTDFKGTLNVNLEFTPDGYAVRPSGDNPAVPADAAPQPGVSLNVAVEEQLGLKLVARKGPIEVLVVDHAERPAEN